KVEGPAIDLKDAMAKAGFSGSLVLGADTVGQRRIEQYVRFGTDERAKRAAKGDQFTLIDINKELGPHREFLAKHTFRVRDIAIAIPKRSDFEEKGLVISCGIGCRVRLAKP